MRVLLDECLPRRLKQALPGHHLRTVPEAGWAGMSNGDLLALAAKDFDVFVTLDQNLQYQQHLEGAGIAIVVLESRSNRFQDLLPLVPHLIDVLRSPLAPGKVVRIGQ